MGHRVPKSPFGRRFSHHLPCKNHHPPPYMVFGREHHLPSYLPFTCPSPALHLPFYMPIQNISCPHKHLQALTSTSRGACELTCPFRPIPFASFGPTVDPHHPTPRSSGRSLAFTRHNRLYNLLALQVHNLTRTLTKDPFSLQVLLA